jgi:hypothetical protein
MTTDPNNCGACGNTCATEICNQGVCVGAVAGNIIAIGMDYEDIHAGTPAAVLLGNAVFLAKRNPVRVLEYREHAASQTNAAINVGEILANEASARGRKANFTLASTASSVSDHLGSHMFDVFLVHHQADAPAGMLGSIGASWATPLQAFVRSSGTVIVLASTAGTSEMKDLLTSANLMTVSSMSVVTGQPVKVQDYLDAVGENVLSPFIAKVASVTFTTPEPPTDTLSFSLVDDSGAPVVAHKVIAPH